ncbi:MAG TPA: pitrilysin family protein [Syntrophales bacterium]|nr:pitrilysin family protein [Syntrophales bacterium]
MKRTLTFSLLILLISTGLCLAEQAEQAKPSPWADPDRLRYEEVKFSPPKPERVVLDNGLTVYYLEDRELPLVNISIVVGAGSVFEPPGKEGLAEMTGDVMRTGGAAKLTGDKVDEELEYLAAPISISLGMDYGTGNLSVLKKDLNRAFKIFSDILRNPAFDEDKLAQEKNLKVEELRRVFDKPQRLAFREFKKAIYAGNPRGRLPEIASVEKIEREDLVSFHKTYFFPRNLRMAVTGDISKQEALDLISKHLGDWDDEGDFGTAPLPKPQENAPLYFYEKKVPQSTVIIGAIGPGKESPDFYPFTILDYILGSGGFRSRIFQEVRSNRGLAYSAGSFYEGRQGYGSFGAYAMTKSESTGQVLTLMDGILKDARESRVPAQDVHLAKRAIVNSYIFSFTSSHLIAFQYMMLEFQGLPTKFLTEYPSMIDAVSREDILKVAEKYLDPEKKTVFVLGDESRFDEPLKSFGKVKKLK